MKRLGHANGWVRDTAQRLLVERTAKEVASNLSELVAKAPTPQAKVHALWTLEGLGALTAKDVLVGLADSHAQVRRNSIELAERFINQPEVLDRICALVRDAEPDVAFHAGLALGVSDSDKAVVALAQAAVGKLESWMRAAIVASATKRELALLKIILQSKIASDSPILGDLGNSFAGNCDPNALDGLFAALDDGSAATINDVQAAVFEGVAAGFRKRAAHGLTVTASSRQKLLDWIAHARSPRNLMSLRRFGALFQIPTGGDLEKLAEAAFVDALDEKLGVENRSAAVEFGGSVAKDKAATRLSGLLTPKQPVEIQTALLRTAFDADQNQALAMAVAVWKNISPQVRRMAIDLALDRRAMHPLVIELVSKGQIGPADISLEQKTRILTRATEAQKKQLTAAMGAGPASDRAKVVQENQDVLKLTASGPRGWQLFRDHCGACHRLENAGRHVGPDLQSVRNHPKERLLDSILNPSHSVDPAYLAYAVETTSGRLVSGIIRSESADSLTLLGADGKSTTIARKDIESCTATGKSLMPEGLEKVIPKQGLADLIAFLRGE